MPIQNMRIGILGCGAIGGFLAQNICADPTLQLSFVYDLNEERMQHLPVSCRVTSETEMLARPADLVVETAHADLVKSVAPRLLEHSDLLIFSVTAFADDDFRSSLQRKATDLGRKIWLPHGAIIGIDGLVDAGPTLQSVTITTTKSPASLGLPSGVSKIVYQGPTRGACLQFPRNVNVHAAIALAGLGFDRTISRIVADPSIQTNNHLIEVVGSGYRFQIEVSSEAGGKVTGAYTPHSALSTLKRICNGTGGLRFA